MPSKSSSLSDGSDQYSSVNRRSMKLNTDELELWEMFHYAGVTLDPQVFRAILDLIHLDIQPKAILDVLESVAPNSKHFVAAANKDDSIPPGRKSKSTSQSFGLQAPSINRKSASRSSSEAVKSESSMQRKIPTSKSDKGDLKMQKR